MTDVYPYPSPPVLIPPPHGSNVASIIGAQGNNGLYMTGVSWNVSLMHLKVISDSDGQGMSSWVAASMAYARTHGASAVNLSLGHFYQLCYYDGETGQYVCDFPSLDPVLFGALRDARASNVIVVCAAGNGIYIPPNNVGQNTDVTPFSPATVPTDNVISVAASDQTDSRPGFSNYGVKTVDVAAPGVSIYGLLATYNANGNDLSNYSVFSGTSQAAPHVTGTIALLKAKYGWESYHGLRDRVLMGTDA